MAQGTFASLCLDSLYVISKGPEADGFCEYVFLPQYWADPFGLILQGRDEQWYAFFFLKLLWVV